MTKEEFLARCALAYDMGLINPERLRLMEKQLDVVMREGHSRLCDLRQIMYGESHDEQWRMVRSFWQGSWGEVARLNKKTNERFGPPKRDEYHALYTLANDVEGYAINNFAAILTHPCQQCATDPNAWHTCQAFCKHQKDIL